VILTLSSTLPEIAPAGKTVRDPRGAPASRRRLAARRPIAHLRRDHRRMPAMAARPATTRAYGSWPSPISAGDLAAASIACSLPRADGADIYWSERRPAEDARVAIVKRTADGALSDVVAAPFSARSKVHEYGGGHYAVREGCVCFVHEADQDLYLVEDGPPARLTDAPDTRFADMAFDPARPRLYAVAERHEEGVPPQNTIAAVWHGGAGAGRIDQLLIGRDFYAAPRPSPDGGRLAWLAWDLPAMPWRAAELWVGTIGEGGGIAAAERVAGGPDDAVFQPEWSGDGALYFVAGLGGWGNLHVWRGGEARPVAEVEAEFARPMWSFGMTSYAVLEPGRLIASCWRDGVSEIGIAAEQAATWTPVRSGFARVDDIVAATGLIAVNGSSDTAQGRVHLIARNAASFEPQAGAKPGPFAEGDISRPRVLAIPAHGVRALYYPPRNRTCRAPEGELPPLVVSAHGGPTGMARRGFALDRQFWTTRGFAFLDVDYRGSTGYGRAFERALDGLWGRADSEDAIAAARFAAVEGLCDPARMVIRGSSAGGLTVLNALIHSDIFAAGASYYGVTDLTALAADTHKFESGYLESLIGGMPDDVPEVCAERSPVNHAGRITSPVIFFQGLEDRVVPPSQSRAMVASLTRRGIPVASLEFEGEGHGFRRAETQIAALEAELAFYARNLGLDPADRLPEIEIVNFRGAR
jgi:dipeptidyl aminopeptidase/acylaminoacyl peptidase